MEFSAFIIGEKILKIFLMWEQAFLFQGRDLSWG